MSSSVDFQEFERHAPDPGAKRDIWKTFWILLGLTLIDLVLYFYIPTGMTKNVIFILLGIVKAYFIVGTFMHLKDEVKSLIWTVILPAMFVVWLLVALIVEGGYIGGVR